MARPSAHSTPRTQDGAWSGARWAVCSVLALLLPVALGGCATVAMTAIGVGASAGVQHTANGISSRTFTASAAQVRSASLAALSRMSISVKAIDTREGAEVIRATSADRQIEIEIEAMSKSTTQMRATAKLNLFVHDAATAKEIVEQTERALMTPDRRAKAPLSATSVKVSAADRRLD